MRELVTMTLKMSIVKTLLITNNEPEDIRVNGHHGVVLCIRSTFDPTDFGDLENFFDAVIFEVPRQLLSPEQLVAIDVVLKGESQPDLNPKGTSDD